ncbi:4Fe-4S dicluster domain-containing protein [Dyadobacter sandarakinus]|uniref:4Fe-4S dicluster domain-containing protein n=1 Tax=Dyadobacter sandarakinus TaxID=2747268 RepID=A0ABX7I9Z1_9BACT|nr:4Fe-4S dicluster domain-containing protein [Dyadobacter sandarakinus]QRR02633.1 4Fe-4S dicluster domain-containing protein [Dyadobacter sandarakinus]
MTIIQQILFILSLGIAAWLVSRRILIISKTIRLGKDENLTDQPGQRLATMMRIAFGQKKMFDKPWVGLLHFMVYAGFLLINIEVLEIILDGITGRHRLFEPLLGDFYPVLIGFFEILALAVLVACSIFLVRRSTGIVSRLQPTRHRELRNWPQLDGKLILIAEIVLMMAILTMNAADSTLQDLDNPHYPQTGTFLISQFLKPVFAGWNEHGLVIYERIAWWVHILGIFAFALYVTYSKHLHIALAFPNTYFTRLVPKGEMKNMPEITSEVRIMLGIDNPPHSEVQAVPERFGARDVQDLSWKNLMDAYSCTECGRCTAACPANITGKKLSPRKIMMDTRDRLEDIGQNMLANKGTFSDDGKALIGDYILEEEILACTTCNACVQECPVLINPLDIILQLRRYKAMDEAKVPASWNMMFQNIDTNQAPWKFAPGDRFNWAESLPK